MRCPILSRLLVFAFLLAPLCARAQNAVAPDASPEIRLEARVTQTPPQQIWIARIDLRDPDVEVRVSLGGGDPDGDGPWQTTLQPLSQIAAREHFEIAVNGDFFVARETQDAEGAKSGYVAGKWASVVGPAATDGFVWAAAPRSRPVLWIDAAKGAHIETLQSVPASARQVLAGSDILVRASVVVAQSDSKFSQTRHPRTAVGLADGGKTLVLVVADGRDPMRAVGLNLAEFADLMKSLGCADALNLDGGGSSEMLKRDAKSGQLRVLNRPSDGRERAVANVLGVSIRGSLRVPSD